VAGVRTPFIRAGTLLRRSTAADLAKTTFAEVIARAGIDPAAIDEVVLGCAGQPAEAQNLARVAALRAGVPEHVPAVTVHRNCASGIEAITQAILRVRAGAGELYLVGGVEAMSQAPIFFPDKMQEWLLFLTKARTTGKKLSLLLKLRPSHFTPRPGLLLGLRDPISGLLMGETGEVLAREFDVSREQQDRLALESHQRAEAAWERHLLSDEVVPYLPPPDYREVVSEDNGYHAGISLEKLGRLSPYFDRTDGTITVGNACQLTDGSAALLIASQDWVERHGVAPLGWIRDHAYAGLDPRRMGLGPVFATARLLEQTGSRLGDFQRIELNEAFAAQVLACRKAFASTRFAREELHRGEALGEIDPATLNRNGGAIALGHPVGATGTRLVLTLLHELRREGLERGLATLCIGGGQGAALEVTT
jgi:acetyl-CoA C-acetyltransferase/acetyl-CoA acyltransferase